MGKKVLHYEEVLSQLMQGNCILYQGGAEPKAYMNIENTVVTVRLDTLRKLRRLGLITGYGYPALHSKVYLKDQEKEE